MKKVILTLVGTIAAAFISSSHADYAPGDAYLACGDYLIAIETTVEQRMDNFMKSSTDHDRYGSDITFDVEVLYEGKIAVYPDADKEGEAYREYFLLEESTGDGAGFKVNRLSGTLLSYPPADERWANSRQMLSACESSTNYRFWSNSMRKQGKEPPCIEEAKKAKKAQWQEVAKCQKTSNKNLKTSVDRHNETVGVPKF